VLRADALARDELCIKCSAYAGNLLQSFIGSFAGIYGQDMIVYYMHIVHITINHLAEDAK
jgi:hypothetical protein